jgi:hypothetical protein
VTIEFFTRLVHRLPQVTHHLEMAFSAELDECLLSLSLNLWKCGVPIHFFPPNLLSFLPPPKFRSRPVQRVEGAGIFRGGNSSRNRSLQFLYEAQRVSAIEGMVHRVTGHYLPPELVYHVSTLCLTSLNLPCSAEFKRIWAPWPRHLIRTSEGVKSGSLRRDLQWSRAERKFVQLPKAT